MNTFIHYGENYTEIGTIPKTKELWITMKNTHWNYKTFQYWEKKHSQVCTNQYEIYFYMCKQTFDLIVKHIKFVAKLKPNNTNVWNVN